jgi:hypothetical protein
VIDQRHPALFDVVVRHGSPASRQSRGVIELNACRRPGQGERERAQSALGRTITARRSFVAGRR